MFKFTRLASISIIAAGTLALAGCGDKEAGEAGSEGESAEQATAASDIKPVPGRYEAKFKIVKMDMPGLPPELEGMFKSQLGKIETSVSCLTKEEAEKAEENFFKPPKASGDECTYNDFKIGGGKITADMTCMDGSAKQDMKMTGTYGTDGYAMNVKADGNMGEQKMSMEMEIESSASGDCDGTEKS